MKKETKTSRTPLPPDLQAQLNALDGCPNTNDIPEASAENWRDARRFYKVRKEPISIRGDAAVMDRLRSKHERYQVEINRILREKMVAETDP